jgi:hypothetical protein
MKNKKSNKGQESTTIEMPEVKDIPGQEHVKPPRMGEMIDSTASSAGEEGEGIVDDLNNEDDELITDDTSNVSRHEKRMLNQTDRPLTDETLDLKKTALDQTDGEDPLNESGVAMDMGEDLDVPGSELDDDNEELGEEDEENNSYSTKD